MANFIEADVIQKIATEAEWLTQTRIPYKGQIMLVGDSSGKVTNIKVGDGVNPFADLNYMFDSIQQNAQYVPITSNALPTPVADPAWGMVTGGTYTFGGVDVFTVPDGHWGIANYSSGAWSLVDMGELPQVEGTDTLESEEIPKGKAVERYVDDKTQPINENFKLSRNLLDKSKIVAGQFDYASEYSGGINNTNNWIRTELIYLPDLGFEVGDWVTVQGHRPREINQAAVILYQNNSMSGSRIRMFGDGVSDFTTFQVTAPYLYMGVNIDNGVDLALNPTSSYYYELIMISKSQTVIPYEEYGYWLDPDKYPSKEQVDLNTENIGVVLDQYEKVYIFNGTNSQMQLPTTYVLSSAGDYVEFRTRWTGLDYTQGLGLVGSKYGNYQTLGFFTQTQLWLRTAIGTPYVEFNDIPNTAEKQRTYRIQVSNDLSNFELFIDNVLVQSKPKNSVDFFQINNIGQSYSLDWFKGEIGFLNIKSEGILYKYEDLTRLPLASNVSTKLFSKEPQGGYAENMPPVFYEFNPTGFDGRGLFIVYTKRGDTDYYIGHHVANDYNMTNAAYKDIYRIVYAHEYRFMDESMVKISDYTIYQGESECVFRMEGDRRDHTGGTHGDETMQFVKFFANGIELATSAPIPLKPCNDFFYVQKSTMHYTPLTSEPYGNHEDICTHYKKTMFNEKGYVTENGLVGLLEEGLPILHWFPGICCVGKIQAQYVMNEYFDIMEMTGTDTNSLLAVPGSRNYTGWNLDQDKSIYITSKIINDDILDKNAYVFVWDRPNDSKYYRKTTPFVLAKDQILKSVMNVNYK